MAGTLVYLMQAVQSTHIDQNGRGEGCQESHFFKSADRPSSSLFNIFISLCSSCYKDLPKERGWFCSNGWYNQRFAVLGVCGAFSPWTPFACQGHIRSGAFGQSTVYTSCICPLWTGIRGLQ